MLTITTRKWLGDNAMLWNFFQLLYIKMIERYLHFIYKMEKYTCVERGCYNLIPKWLGFGQPSVGKIISGFRIWTFDVANSFHLESLIWKSDEMLHKASPGRIVLLICGDDLMMAFEMENGRLLILPMPLDSNHRVPACCCLFVPQICSSLGSTLKPATWISVILNWETACLWIPLSLSPAIISSWMNCSFGSFSQLEFLSDALLQEYCSTGA